MTNQRGVQRGFALLEMLIAAALALLVAVWASQTLVHRISDAGAHSAANWMFATKDAVRAYLVRHGAQLRHATSSTDLLLHGYSNWAAPQIAELKQDGLLATGFPESMRNVGGLRISILRDGECPGDDCRLEALIYSQRAFLKSPDVIDEQMMAQWLLETKGLGGAVHPLQPDVVRGHTFEYPNPIPTGTLLPPGTVAMMISDEQLNEHAYLRVRDQRDPQFQADATIKGNVTAGGVISAGQTIHLGSSADWLDHCSVEGTVTRDRMYGLLVCDGGVWQSAGRSAGGYSVNSRYNCFTPEGRSSANPVTGSCSCPSDYRAVPISEGGTDDADRGITRGYLCVY